MDSAKTFEEFKEILKSYEMKTFSKFNVYQSRKSFLDGKRDISKDLRLHWKDGLPYYHFGSRIYTCHQGKDKNLGKKQKYMEQKQEKEKTDLIFTKTYNLTQPTKKLDCPASITVSRVFTLPQFKLENPIKSKKVAISAQIKSKLRNNEDIEGEEAFWFTLPSEDAHKNHMPIPEPVDPLVRSKIKELVHEGKRDASVISELLEVFVTTDLKQNDRKRRSFFPDIPAIQEIIREGKREIRKSKIAMKNTENHENTQGAVENGKLKKRGKKRRKLIIDMENTENHENTQGAVVYEECTAVYGELEEGDNKRRKLINECDSHLQYLGSVLWMLSESALLELEKDLQSLSEKMLNT